MSTQTCSQTGNTGSDVGGNGSCNSGGNGGGFGSNSFRMIVGIIAVVAVAGGIYIWSQSSSEPAPSTRAQTPNRVNAPTPANTTVPSTPPAPATPAAPAPAPTTSGS